MVKNLVSVQDTLDPKQNTELTLASREFNEGQVRSELWTLEPAVIEEGWRALPASHCIPAVPVPLAGHQRQARQA